MVLPSNASTKIHPNNSLTDYTVQLPVPIHLEGKYEVGLQSLEYTRSWNNVIKGQNRVKFSINGIGMEVDIEHGFYSSEEDVIDMLNTFISREIINREATDDTIKKMTKIAGSDKFIYFDYQKRSRHVTLFRAPFTSVWMSPQLASLLGFVKNNFGSIAAESISLDSYMHTLKTTPHTANNSELQVDYHCALHMLYVYCNIVTGQIVGDVWAPLLKAVPVSGEHGANVVAEYERPQYIPVLTNQFASITISIRDDAGEKVSFERGRVTATLHFRRQSEL